ncbi:ribonuclease H-like protein [Xylaria bambusicola]|uniref:ribonuclease H-like protein n=1 Tax=Xylaria bambusicola TaxID=326684 RepID=UPI0020082FF2|nr:ribonuclease H-like protein [Xylaria bambusicola]KAI0522115.1 ribonuclease H-like protein [Xylaria bambusicola]
MSFSALDYQLGGLAGLTGDEVQGEATGLLNTSAAISSMVNELSELLTTPPSLYLDLEGVNLSRHGTISILQIHVRTTGQSYLVDVKTLGEMVFSTPGIRTPNTLNEILESPSIAKVLFDLKGVQDLQLMELATRPEGRRQFVSGLKSCISRDLPVTPMEKSEWMKTKDDGKKLFAPEQGGSYELFNQWPLPERIRAYCVQDVHYLPRLWDLYDHKLTEAWRAKVLEATEARVAQSQAPDYIGQGKHKMLAPAGWASC